MTFLYMKLKKGVLRYSLIFQTQFNQGIKKKI